VGYERGQIRLLRVLRIGHGAWAVEVFFSMRAFTTYMFILVDNNQYRFKPHAAL
jgi:hypothetical protein